MLTYKEALIMLVTWYAGSTFNTGVIWVFYGSGITFKTQSFGD
jgi:hypothetical protein